MTPGSIRTPGFRLGSHIWIGCSENRIQFAHDMWVWPAHNKAGSYISTLAGDANSKRVLCIFGCGSGVNSGNIRTWIAPEPVSRNAPDPQAGNCSRTYVNLTFKWVFNCPVDSFFIGQIPEDGNKGVNVLLKELKCFVWPQFKSTALIKVLPVVKTKWNSLPHLLWIWQPLGLGDMPRILQVNCEVFFISPEPLRKIHQAFMKAF